MNRRYYLRKHPYKNSRIIATTTTHSIVASCNNSSKHEIDQIQPEHNPHKTREAFLIMNEK
jgi:hypothetical protein